MNELMEIICISSVICEAVIAFFVGLLVVVLGSGFYN